jgi:hypothetical protein
MQFHHLPGEDANKLFIVNYNTSSLKKPEAIPLASTRFIFSYISYKYDKYEIGEISCSVKATMGNTSSGRSRLEREARSSSRKKHGRSSRSSREIAIVKADKFHAMAMKVLKMFAEPEEAPED